MLPHEKALVERLENEPFALIGINTDGDKDDYRKQAQEQGVTWRSAWDGSTKGPWSTAWGVSSFPTIYVLDARGTIRYVNVRNEKMDAAVVALLAELKAGAVPEPAGSRAAPAPGSAPASEIVPSSGDKKPDKPAPKEPEIPTGLKVGQRAPDFTAKDTEGVEFKLSDYRGKVVVLDFWGFW